MADDVLSLENGERNGASEELEPGQSRAILHSPNGNDAGARLVTIQIGIDVVPPNPAGELDVDVYVDLSWGVARAAQSVQVDVLRGTAITLTATTFDIKATYRRNVATIGGQTTGPKVRVSALATYDPKPGSALGSNARLTQRLPKLGPSLRSTTVDVPPWATHVLVLTSSPSLLQSTLVNVDCLTAASLTEYQVQPTAQFDAQAVPLSNVVRKVKITSAGGFDAGFSLLWSLCL